MAKEFAKAFYKSKAWQDCRYAYITSVNGLCETCLKRGRIVPGKIVHHKTNLTPDNIGDPYVSLSFDKLRYDCQDCHNKEHGERYGVTADGLMFNAAGDLIQA